MKKLKNLQKKFLMKIFLLEQSLSKMRKQRIVYEMYDKIVTLAKLIK